MNVSRQALEQFPLPGPLGLFLSTGHIAISANALQGFGLSPSFIQDVTYASAGLDYAPGSQAPANANIHSMTMPNQSPTQAAESAMAFVNAQLSRCDATGLGYALHTVQDIAAGGHQFKTYRGILDLILNDPMHFVHDLWPNSDAYQEAFVKSQNVIGRYLQECACKAK